MKKKREKRRRIRNGKRVKGNGKRRPPFTCQHKSVSLAPPPDLLGGRPSISGTHEAWKDDRMGPEKNDVNALNFNRVFLENFRFLTFDNVFRVFTDFLQY